MSEGKKPLNEGYQPRTNGEQRGYQPKPNGNFGYQPPRATSKPPAPPTTGSNAVKPKSDK